jgi:DNA invertase Pin-like site-specific DNA recombinase
MTNALVVRNNTQLARSQKSLRAAQYVRMSTDYQKYSIENQAVVIAAYAQAHSLDIVRTYADKGESGLKLRNRSGLIELLNDVESGEADFGWILVLDVSRWGRFQDIDESAHYEFVCRQAGIRIAYCAEQFENDGSLLSNIVKNLKRVMAAEYSRELSAKVHAGQCRYASLGFKLGGPAAYALQRQLVDANQQSKGVLEAGDRKALQTDHVRLQPGAPHEVALVQWIFQRFRQQPSEMAIARELNRSGILTNTGRRWSNKLVGRLLRNENYVGNLVFNRRSSKLKTPSVNNPPDLWIRSEGCIAPIVEHDIFWQANKIIAERRVSLPEEEMLARLRRTLLKRGKLSPKIIDETLGLPCAASYQLHFGSLRNAYRLIGYESRRNCDYADTRKAWTDRLVALAEQVATKIQEGNGFVAYDASTDCWLINDTLSISFRMARWRASELAHYSPQWSIPRKVHPDTGWIVAIRLGANNQEVLDYVLLPTPSPAGRLIRFSEKNRARRGVRRFDTPAALIRSISRLATKSPASIAKSARSKPPRKSGAPKSENGRALH